jgi:hypothetical protein
LSQIDTITPKWSAEEKAIFEIDIDSMDISTYSIPKDSIFKQFWDTFPEEEQRQMGLILIEHMYYTSEHRDTVNYEDWLQKMNFYVNFGILLERYGSSKAKKAIEIYYAQRFDTIALIFWYEENKIVLNNNFKVYFITQQNQNSKIIQAKTTGSSFIVPNFGTDSVKGIILFEYQHKIYVMSDMRNLLSVRNTDSIKMIFDTKPYTPKKERSGNWQFFNDRYDSSHDEAKRSVSECCGQAIGFFAVFGNRWNTYRCIPIYSKRTIFKEEKRILKQARKK